MCFAKKEKKEFIDYLLYFMETLLIGTIILFLIPFGIFMIGAVVFVYLYPHDSGRIDSGMFFVGVGIVFYYGLMAGIWYKKIAAEGWKKQIVNSIFLSFRIQGEISQPDVPKQ